MACSKEKTSLIEEAQKTANELLRLLEECIHLRQNTIQELRTIANELDATKKDINITKGTGSAVAVGGGILVIAGAAVSFFVFALGVDASTVGGVTSGGAEAVGSYVSSAKIEKAQREMDNDNKLTEKIDEKEKKLKSQTKIIDEQLKLGEENVFCILFMSGKLKNTDTASARLLLPIAVAIDKMFRKIAAETTTPIVEMASKAVAGVTLKGVQLASKALLGAFAFLVMDVATLIKTSIDIHKGSKSDAARTLRKIADEMETRLKDTQQFIEIIRKLRESFQETLKEEFLKLLCTISPKGHITTEEANTIIAYLQQYASPEFCEAFNGCGINQQEFGFCISRLCHVLDTQIREGAQNYPNREYINITLIAHGGIYSPLIPSQLHFLTRDVSEVTLYPPWGCAIDASVVYGILTRTINPATVRYSGDILPRRPSTWDTLPVGFRPIPRVQLSPVHVAEDAYRELEHLHATLNLPMHDIIIPYVIGPTGLNLPFPDVPLWVLCCALGLLGTFHQRYCHINVACCLTCRDRDLIDPLTNHVRETVYCTVEVRRPPVMMTNPVAIPRNIGALLGIFQSIL